jgi:SH3-like domain-containing protein
MKHQTPRNGSVSLLCLVAVSTISVPLSANTAGLATPAERAAGQTPSKLPVPRFVSLRYNKVNGRAGPDGNYPIRWVYERRGLPVQVTAETDNWRRIQDPEGGTVWVHKRTLDGRRTAMIRPTRDLRTGLYSKPQDGARVVAWLADGVVAEITDTRPGWREIRTGRLQGWVPLADLWGGQSPTDR